MRYFGGKQRISKPLSEFLNSQLETNQPFIDAFCGSCNVISKIDNDRIRIANDIHPELIAMWKYVQNGGILPDNITQEEYYRIKECGEDWEKGFVGFGCSFAGKWWGGYARDHTQGKNYCCLAKNSTLKKIKDMQDVIFNNENYSELDIPIGALIYCDIPYKDSTGYSSGKFNHEKFYRWAKEIKKIGNGIFISEYAKNVPSDGLIVWNHKSKKIIRNSGGVAEETEEILFTYA